MDKTTEAILVELKKASKVVANKTENWTSCYNLCKFW